MGKILKENEVSEPPKPICGVVMPISEIDGCSEGHWKEVMAIITQAVELAGFSCNLVSYADEVGVIQKRIVQNLYDNPIVVCDVSGKNPNVMFELGMRLAFDKATIIIKDDKTNYSFDTSPIEHLEYPRDLRFSKIVEFKERLSEKISQTHKKATSDPEYSTFLKHFGSFKIAKIDTEVVSKEDFILEEMKALREQVSRMSRASMQRNRGFNYDEGRLTEKADDDSLVICFGETLPSHIDPLIAEIRSLSWVLRTNLVKKGAKHIHLEVETLSEVPRELAMITLKRIVGDSANYIR